MKNIIKYILLYSTALFVLGCNKKLDTIPTASIDAGSALTTSVDVKLALVGAYKDFGTADFFGGRIFLEGDLMAYGSEINWSGSYQELTQINNHTIPVDNAFVANNWLAGYTAINDVNNVLSAIDVVDAAEKDKVEGESKFIRGASYFELVKKFAKSWNDGDPSANPGVPLVLTPTHSITEESKVKRNTVAEVYAQVIKDLQDAEAKLPQSNGFFATQAAAAAMLARVYLQQGDYANAAKEADNAISTTDATLAPGYADAFGVTSDEDIFAIQVTTATGTQGFNEFYSESNRGDIQIMGAHLGLYDADDDRLNLFSQPDPDVYTLKFEEIYGNVHTIRLAEMYLVRAEANFRIGTSVGDKPVNDINVIRNRVKLPSFTAAELTLAIILNERRLELAFEGFALDDLKRLKGSLANLLWNSPKLIFPIPKREILVNSNLTQNEGY
ncbi:MAG: RagB/SusD family nutrient uptake outer membrane protein [Ginsengibacter sp.]